ncbi:hypothetical protein P7K49_015933 [Saguinus oedipus]|uniref:Uncharacterized protein n=1 Tax=Saguinus oedipus TaxID=9490 RepID=A0ABQ9VBX8_SAGOE|nr:hypothetical protein P7K49_015933 [Saguinus oedipus]
MPGWTPIPAVPSAMANIFHLQPGASRPHSPACKTYTHTSRMLPFSLPPDACSYCATLEPGATCPCLGPRTEEERSLGVHTDGDLITIMPSALHYTPLLSHLEKTASQEPCLRDCGSFGLKPGEQTWKDFKLLANTAQIEARSSGRNWG